MFLRAIVLGGDVLESTFYHQTTGEPQYGYSVKLTVFDAETKEKYECQLTDGFPTLEQLKDMKRRNYPLDQLQQAAQQLRTELPPELTVLALEVVRIKAKNTFLTLVCRMAQGA